MKYRTIYCDCDGVLAKFTTSVIKQLNDETGMNVTIDDVVDHSEWGLEKMWNMTQEEWWGKIEKNPNFWLELEPFPWAEMLYNKLLDHADEVIILTSPSKSENCIPHKIQWLEENIGVSRHNIIAAKKKYLFARNDALLIDDAPHNIDPFVENGGVGVLLPSDWNTRNLSFGVVWEKIEDTLLTTN